MKKLTQLQQKMGDFHFENYCKQKISDFAKRVFLFLGWQTDETEEPSRFGIFISFRSLHFVCVYGDGDGGSEWKWSDLHH